MRASKLMFEKEKIPEPRKHLVERDLSRNGSMAPRSLLGTLVRFETAALVP